MVSSVAPAEMRINLRQTPEQTARLLLGRIDPEEPSKEKVQSLTWAFKGLYAEVYPTILQSLRAVEIPEEGIQSVKNAVVLVVWNEVCRLVWPNRKIEVIEQ